MVRVSTSPGSFVLSLALPLYEARIVPVDESELQAVVQTAMDESIEVEAIPYGRLVVDRMRSVAERALEVATQVADGHEDITAYETDPAASGNATELAALAALGGRTQRRYQLRFTASPMVHGERPEPALIVVDPPAQESFGKAAKLLRDRKPKDNVTVIGKVVRLAREGLAPGEIGVRGRESGARSEHRFRMQLTDEQYRQALEAHSRGADVLVSGDLAVRGNFLTIDPLRWFAVQQALPESPPE